VSGLYFSLYAHILNCLAVWLETQKKVPELKLIDLISVSVRLLIKFTADI